MKYISQESIDEKLKYIEDPLKRECPEYDTQLHLLEKLKFWTSDKCGVTS